MEVERPGRRRDDTRDPVILQAALDLIGEVGYEQMSMEAVAARAHASKATIYRRWSSKAELVAQAVKDRQCVALVLPPEGDLRADLLLAVRTIAGSMSGTELAVLTGIYAGMRSDAQLAASLRCDVRAAHNSLSEPLFTRAAQRGDRLRADAERLFQDMVPALLMHRLIATDQPADEQFVVHVVDDILLPVLSC